MIRKFREIATAIKNDLITNGPTPEKRACVHCRNTYDANAIWPYTICKECASREYWEHRKLWITNVLGLSEEYVTFYPLVSPMDISKYRLQNDE
ncbi:hypothetical protein ACT9XH_00690 [Methanococcoides methylutens]|uniref:hypothetical protein n=1 Tax=Methanococcoides methylutens TaxID=2226 RepID=UPI004045165C